MSTGRARRTTRSASAATRVRSFPRRRDAAVGTATTKAIRVSLKNVSISGLGGGIGNAGAVEQQQRADVPHQGRGLVAVRPVAGGDFLPHRSEQDRRRGRRRVRRSRRRAARAAPAATGSSTTAWCRWAAKSIRSSSRRTSRCTTRAVLTPPYRTPPIHVFGSNNYWGGGPPTVAHQRPFNAASGKNVVISGDVTFTSTSFLANDPGAP